MSQMKRTSNSKSTFTEPKKWMEPASFYSFFHSHSFTKYKQGDVVKYKELEASMDHARELRIQSHATSSLAQITFL